METLSEQIISQQKATWNKFSAGWRKWDDFTMNFTKPAGDEIIQLLNLKKTDTVLDVASGTGEPGLTIAGIIKSGKVVVTDLAEEMLKIAREKAEAFGLKNFETVVCDASNLPFNDNTFDAVSCRFGFMFFPDMLLTAKELTRVLKPGGRIAASVWNSPEKNPWITFGMGVIKANMELPPPPPPTHPGMFRCSEKGLIARLFNEAGLKNVSEKEVSFKYNIGTPDAYWSYMNEVSVSAVMALKNANNETIKK